MSENRKNNSAFWQWDLEREIRVPEDATEVHFKTGETLLSVPAVDGTAQIPNILLQQAGHITAYGWGRDHTMFHTTFAVQKRPKPPQYVYTETETLTWESLAQQVKDDIVRVELMADATGECAAKAEQAASTAQSAAERSEAAQATACEAKETAEAAKNETVSCVETARKSAETAVQAANKASNAASSLMISQMASGEMVHVEDSAEYPLQSLTICGKSTQDGEPTPDNPVEIVSVENPAVTACGVNLFPYPYKNTTKTSNGVTYTDNGDGTVTANGMATATADFYIFDEPKNNGKYLYIPKGTYWCGGDDWDGVRLICGEKGGRATSSASQLVALLKTQDCYFYRVALRVSSEATVNTTVRPQLNLGGTAAGYEPYKGSTTTANITLRGLPVSSGGNYTDSTGQQWIADTLIVSADGSGQLVRRIDAKLDVQTGTATHDDCILSDPIVTDYTAEEMAQIMPVLSSYKPVTNVFADQSAGFAVEYAADPKAYIDNQINNLTALVLEKEA